jgi:hypothetical protein
MRERNEMLENIIGIFVLLLILFPIIAISFSMHREYRVSKPSFVPLNIEEIDEKLRKRLLFLLKPLRNLPFLSHTKMKIVSCTYEGALFVLVVTDSQFIEIVDIKASIFCGVTLYYSVTEEEKQERLLHLDDKTYLYTLLKIQNYIHNVRGRVHLEEIHRK